MLIIDHYLLWGRIIVFKLYLKLIFYSSHLLSKCQTVKDRLMRIMTKPREKAGPNRPLLWLDFISLVS